MQRLFSLLYIAAVCIILLTPLALWVSGKEDPRANFENRALAPMPELNIGYLDPFPGAFENHFNDHFPYRSSAIFALNNADIQLFGKSPMQDQVVMGNDGWLYPGAPDLEFTLGLRPPSENMLTAMIRELNGRGAYCRERGAEYRFIIVPGKSQMYPEHLPACYQDLNLKSPAELLVDRCEKECTVPVLYLRDSLMKYKPRCELYLPRDSHWNDMGSYYGYRSIMNWIYPDGPDVPLLSSDVEDCQAYFLGPCNYSTMIGMGDEWHDTIFVLTLGHTDTLTKQVQEPVYPRDTMWFAYWRDYDNIFYRPDTSLPRVMVVHDSYTNRVMQEALSDHFSRTTFIWDYWQHKLNKEIVDAEKPDVVLCICSELFLMDLMKFPNRAETGGENHIAEVRCLLGGAMGRLYHLTSGKPAT